MSEGLRRLFFIVLFNALEHTILIIAPGTSCPVQSAAATFPLFQDYDSGLMLFP